MEGDLQQDWGRDIRAIRVERGLTQAGLAEAIGWNRTYVGAIERGERNVTLRTVERYCEALGVVPAITITSRAARPNLRAASAGGDPKQNRRATPKTKRPRPPTPED